MEITTISFDKECIDALSNMDKGMNWPVVYIIHNNKVVYIGETSSVMNRLLEHTKNPARNCLDTVEIIVDDKFNKSAVLDFEQNLIRLCKADDKFEEVQNLNDGQSASHEYYDRIYYENMIPDLWRMLMDRKLANRDFYNIINNNIYKYSPYTSLNGEQLSIYRDVLFDVYDSLTHGRKGDFVITGGAGTGKTILAVKLLYTLNILGKKGIEEIISDEDEDIATVNHFSKYVQERGKLKVGLCISMESLRETLKNVVKECGIGRGLVFGPSDIAKKEFDVVIVDEAHRLKQRKNLGHNYATFEKTSKRLGLDPNECTQLDWIEHNSRYCILFYDENQSIKGADITPEQFQYSVGQTNIRTLTTQMRCRGGKAFTRYIDDILGCKKPDREHFGNEFQFMLFDDVQKMVETIRLKDTTEKLCRNVAGFSWKWVTQGMSYDDIIADGLYDIEIDNNKYIWNTERVGWILSKHAIDEIGSVHTTQGFDLNYVGVIFGPEIDYDIKTDSIVIDETKFFDSNVKLKASKKELHRYVINAYKVLLTRGIKGCYVYAYNDGLREYFRRYID